MLSSVVISRRWSAVVRFGPGTIAGSPPDENWEKAIGRHLESASLILLLVSADFIASDYCWGFEMRRFQGLKVSQGEEE